MEWINANEKFPDIIRTENQTYYGVHDINDEVEYYDEYSKEVLVKVDNKILGYGNLYKEYEAGKFDCYGIHISALDMDYNLAGSNKVEWCAVE